MKAVILAAGYGSRMYPMTQNSPKCLLTIGGETILGREIRILKECGVNDITVITGFCSDKIAKLYGQEVSIRHNPHYEITNSIFTLWTAREVLNDDVIIMNSDVIFSKELIEKMIQCDGIFCGMILEGEDSDGAMRVKIVDDTVVDMSIVLPINESFGEWISLVKVKNEGIKLFKDAIYETAKENAMSYWSESFTKLVRQGCKIDFLPITGLWAEIDTKDDYLKAKRLITQKGAI